MPSGCQLGNSVQILTEACAGRAVWNPAPAPLMPLLSLQPGAETFLLGVCRMDPFGLEVALTFRAVSWNSVPNGQKGVTPEMQGE